MKKYSLLPCIFFLSGCIGTDIINDPVETFPERIEITPVTAAIEVDSSFQFTAVFYDTLGEPVNDMSFSWRSQDMSVAMVSGSGTFTGLQPGQTFIFAEAGGVESSPVLLTVVANPNQVASVVITESQVQLGIGDTVQLNAIAYNLNGDVLQNKTFTWISNNTQVATVNGSGLVSAIGNGAAQIIAATDNVQSMPTTISVTSGTRTGQFEQRQNSGYNVAGTVTLRELDEGQLRLELGSDFTTSAGPGLVVMLSSSNVVNSNSINLGDLQNFNGSQTYAVPSNIELTTFDWVIIHCLPFNVTFGYAELE